jgi:hypothetical protein
MTPGIKGWAFEKPPGFDGWRDHNRNRWRQVCRLGSGDRQMTEYQEGQTYIEGGQIFICEKPKPRFGWKRFWLPLLIMVAVFCALGWFSAHQTVDGFGDDPADQPYSLP